MAHEQMGAELQSLVAARIERLGYLGEFFQVAAHQPDALAAFIRFTEELKAALPWRLVETVALTVASETANGYERVQHERLALRLGMRDDEVRAIVAGRLDDRFSGAERAAAELARGIVHSHGQGCSALFEALLDLTDDATAVGCAMTAARYLAHAAMANTWELVVPVSSPLAAEAPSA
jgi:alkylhydroperoxidase family enzyme